ncbi:hypothetical protein EON63_11940 [archaeon]|nr:MAG: hypothetical protein EON63_11940 [archaeon]
MPSRGSDVASLMQGAGFSLPTIDIEKVTISYPNAFTLLEHIHRMGEGHACIRREFSVGRDVFLSMAALYQR